VNVQLVVSLAFLVKSDSALARNFEFKIRTISITGITVVVSYLFIEFTFTNFNLSVLIAIVKV